MEAIWPGPDVQRADHSEPVETARNFVLDVVGEAPAQVQDAGPSPGGDLFSNLDVVLDNGVSFEVTLHSSRQGWVVLSVGGFSAFNYDSDPFALGLANGVGNAVQVDVSWRDSSGVHVQSFPADEIRDGAVPINVMGDLLQVVVVLRDGARAPLDVFGAALRQGTVEPIEPGASA
jgi:hypothetical protein